MKKCLMFIPLILIVFLVGCGKKEEIVISDLSSAISESVKFSERLTQLDTENIEKRYSLNTKDYADAVAFVGTVSTCDEYVIIKTESAESVAKKLKEYVSNKKDDYKTYRPNETYKLDSAMIEVHNNSVVMIITEDSKKAQNVYEEYLKK